MRNATRSRRLTALLTLGLGCALLAGCAAESPDPETARDALAEVKEDPAPADNQELYDAELEPDPIVDPLECTRYLVVTARGTGEPAKKQLLGPVVRAIKDARPGEVQQLDLDYPADTEVKDGGTLGARTLVDTLNVQAEACPDQRFILLGYSQGALVIGDSLAAPEHRLVGLRVGEVDAEAASRVLAVVLYGNPRFLGAASYNAGTFDPSANGLLPRPAGGLDAYDTRLRDYCVGTDFICQSTLDLELDDTGHIAYYDNGMQQDGAAFAITQLEPIDKKSAEARDAQEKADAKAKKDAKKQSDSADADDSVSPDDASKTDETDATDAKDQARRAR